MHDMERMDLQAEEQGRFSQGHGYDRAGMKPYLEGQGT